MPERKPRRVPLRQRVDACLQDALGRTSEGSALEGLHSVLLECRERLDQPMRVAIVGLIKAGKSTLMNALLGEAVVATGTVEATFNINWLRYGETPSMRVHFKDARPPEAKTLAELESLTRRADANRDYLLGIQHVEVFYPNPLLQTLNLIDTPGLASYYEDDSQNTRAFLQLHGQEITEATQKEASSADAVLYLFSQSIAATDQEVITEFLGPLMGRATPINAIGVLTKVDVYGSDPNIRDPMEAGLRIARRLSENPQVRPLFYTIYPLCGLLAYGAATLHPEEFEILAELARLPSERFESLIRVEARFRDREYPDVSVPPARRQQVLARLGQYGVGLAYRLIQEGITDRDRLASALLERSGIVRLREVLLSHFGNRALVIKLGTALRQIEAACFRERQRLIGADRQTVDEIAGAFEAMEAQEDAFEELRALRSYYEGRLALTPEEAANLLAVTGEFGRWCGERLGLGERATLPEMLAVAEERIGYWRQRAADFMAADRQTIEAAEALARSYERIFYHLKEAESHLLL